VEEWSGTVSRQFALSRSAKAVATAAVKRPNLRVYSYIMALSKMVELRGPIGMESN